MRGFRGYRAESVELQREKERSVNEGGTKETDRRWEAKGTERREEGRKYWSGRKKKMTGQITLHADGENYY